MDITNRVIGFLILHESLDFCDQCLAGRLDISVERLREILALYDKSAPILRDRWACRECGRVTAVTRAVPNSTFALNRRSRTRLQQIA
jgi:hypothetical protein